MGHPVVPISEWQKRSRNDDEDGDGGDVDDGFPIPQQQLPSRPYIALLSGTTSLPPSFYPRLIEAIAIAK